MTEDKIKAIAEEIANTLYNEDESYNHMLWWSIDPKGRKAEELEMTLKVMLRDYCIVEREKVMEEYKREKHWNTDSEGVIMLENLFGKESLNQNEK